MKSTMKWMAPVVALGLLVGLGASNGAAADKAATGTITGTVTDKDGKPAEGAMVRLMEQPSKEEKQAAEDGADRVRRTPVTTAYTDGDGKFEMKDVAAGTYQIQAGVRKVSAGREKVTVVAGQEAQVSITVRPVGEKPEAGSAGDDKKEKKQERQEKKNKRAGQAN